MNNNSQNNENTSTKRYRNVSKNKKDLLKKFVFTDGYSIVDAANQLDIKYTNARKILSRIKAAENNAFNLPSTSAGKPKKITNQVLNEIETICTQNPSCTLKTIRNMLERQTSIRLSFGSVGKSLDSLKITLKKSTTIHNLVNSPQTIERRLTYANNFSNNAPREPKKCIFIDESRFIYHLRRKQARSKKGTRAVVRIPSVRGRIQSLILAVSGENIVYSKVITDGTCNGLKFTIFIEELITILNMDPNYQNAWIILDNARIHHVPEVQAAFSETNYHLVYLSPYSYILTR